MTPEQLKASILQRAMEGKLVPQDPNDEPASELLKRIKAEKEKLIKEGKIKRDKNETEIYRGDDGLHYEKFGDGSVKVFEKDVPDGWAIAHFPEICAIEKGSIKRGPFGSSITKAMFVPKGDNTYKVYEQGNAIRKNLEYGEYWLPKADFQRLEGFAVKPRDVIVSCAGTIGETFIIPKDAPEGVINQALLRLTLNNEIIDEQFFLLMFKSLVETLKSNAVGSAIKNLASIKFLKYETPFLLPPIAEQKKIVTKIREVFEKVDKYSESYLKLEKLNKEFPEKLRKSILQYAMQGKLVSQDPNDEPVEVLLEKIRTEKQKLFEEGKLKKKDLEESIIYKAEDNSYYEKSGDKQIHIDVPFDIPEHWKWVKLNYICHYIQRGKSPKYVEKSEIPIISQKCIQWSGFDLSPARFLDPKYFSSYDNIRLVRHNDLLWCSTGKGTVGRIGIFTDDDRGIYSNIVADSHVTVIRQFDEINSNFTLEYLSSPEIQMNMDDLTTGSTKQQELSLSTVTNILLPICGRSEQDKIISKITQFERYIYQIQIIV